MAHQRKSMHMIADVFWTHNIISNITLDGMNKKFFGIAAFDKDYFAHVSFRILRYDKLTNVAHQGKSM